jgi:hypothetical protein
MTFLLHHMLAIKKKEIIRNGNTKVAKEEIRIK